jgi:hypothetical protein
MTGTAPALTIDPPAASWRGLPTPRPHHPWAADFRRQLGLPVGVPLIMTGHQPTLWHAGILAKYLAAGAAARALGAVPAWLVVDQDEVGPLEIRYPRLERGVPRAGRVVLSDAGPAEPPAAGRAVTRELGPLRTAYADQASRTTPASPDVAAGLARIESALAEAAEGSANLAEQVASALALLMEPLTPPAPTVFATALSRTDAFARLWDRMRADPAACVSAYNEAAAAFPHAGVRTLAAAPGRVELPVWRLEPGSARRRVFSDAASGVPAHTLAPRALLMTGLVRLCGCDLFIHGTGGHAYDRITDRWLERWLGVAALAPTALVTATLRITPPGVEGLEPESVWRARWRASHARHNPGALDDADAARAKGELLRAIASAPRRSPARRELFRRLHEGLERYRAAHAARLGAIDADARALSERLDALGVLADRTWPFPLHPPAALAGLSDAINAAFRDGAS